MTLTQKLVDSALAGVRADIGQRPLVALSMLDGMVKSSLEKVDTAFPYRTISFLRLSAYWNLQGIADASARRAMEFGLEDKARFHRQRLLAFGELRAAEVALHHGESLQAAGSFYMAEALAASAGINLVLSFRQLNEFYFWARHL